MKRSAWPALWGLAWLALATAACEPYCPKGYDKRGGTCYRIKDAGPDAEGDIGPDADDGVELDEAGNPTAADAGEATSPDGGNEIGGNEGMTRGDAGDVEPDATSTSCTRKCGEHQVCQTKDGSEQCACSMGYAACGAEAACVDVKTDPLNCGSCGYACAEGLSCKEGECEQRIRELVLDSFVSCALYDSADGNYPLKCWGDGQFGLFRSAVAESLTPRDVVGVPTVRALALFGPNYCMVVPGMDTIRCWGGLGANASTFSSDFALGGVTRIAGAGGETTDGWGASLCGMHGAGDISCWGAAPLNGASYDRTSPQHTFNIDNYRTFNSMDGGNVHTCAVAADGRVGCWGAVGWSGTADGTLGVPNESFAMGVQSSPGVFVQKEEGGSLTGVVKVAAGSTSCATTKTGELWCWGPNDGSAWRTYSGILGAGDESNHRGAVKVALDDVVDVALGWGVHACAIRRGGQVYCWGAARNAGLGAGAVGDGASGSVFTTPQAVPGLHDAVEIRSGATHTCARRRNGQVACWGQNSVGELGDGTKVERLSPTAVVGLY